MTEAFNSLVLTPPEEQVLHWVAQGYLVDEIAQQWRASVTASAAEIRRVYQKLRFDLQATALVAAAASRLIRPPRRFVLPPKGADPGTSCPVDMMCLAKRRPRCDAAGPAGPTHARETRA